MYIEEKKKKIKVQYNVSESNNKNGKFLLFLKGMHNSPLEWDAEKICKDVVDNSYQYYSSYAFMFNKYQFMKPRYIMPKFLTRELKALFDSIFNEYDIKELVIYTLSFASEPLIRYLNLFDDERIKHVYLCAPVVLNINEFIDYRIKDSKIFEYLKYKKNALF